MVKVNCTCAYEDSVIYCFFGVWPHVILNDYKTQPPKPDRGRRWKKGAGKRRGAEPIRSHSRMLIMQLQLYQLTCKLPIWTQRERDREIHGETDRENKDRSKHIVYEISENRKKSD